MSHNVHILEGAYFISDAHYSYKRPELLDLIKAIHLKELQPTQLIFMGDIFDALFGSISNTLKNNQDMVKIINEISQSIEVIYLEGNHDFNLKDVFPYAKIFTIKQQPITCMYEDKKILLAHGDFESNFGYRAYTWLIRNPLILPVLNLLNNVFNDFVLKNLNKYLNVKDDCKEFIGLRKFISKRLEGKYSCDYFIEGHLHQNKIIKFDGFTYINLAAFACNQRYFIVKSSKELELLQEKNFSQGI